MPLCEFYASFSPPDEVGVEIVCLDWLLRYQTPKGELLDVMYRNVKHALFQPAENEMITILHMHLHNPIMVGNKKTKDVQFYTEVRNGLPI